LSAVLAYISLIIVAFLGVIIMVLFDSAFSYAKLAIYPINDSQQ
jgi:hypothetical protein